jgi:CheY-like chemotaxis protein
MPVMDGFAFIRVARELAPEIKVVMSSGSLVESQQQIAENMGISAFLPKPYTIAQLMACVRALFGE